MLNTAPNRQDLTRALQEGQPLVIEAVRPGDGFEYDRQTGMEVCFAPELDGNTVHILVSADVEYNGRDEHTRQGFARDAIDDMWRPVSTVRSERAEDVLLVAEGLLALNPRHVHPAPPEGQAEIIVSPDDVAPVPERDGERFGRDLVALARQKQLPAVVGRTREVDALVRILSKHGKNAACLVGEPGVGKTAIIEKMADRIAAGAVPTSLGNVRLLDVNLAFLSAGASMKNEFEGRMKRLLDHARSEPGTVLFLDEVHLLCAPGNDVSQMVKADLGRGTIRCIGATTPREWRTIESDAALARRFQVVPVSEPTPEDTLQILQGVAPVIATHHQVDIPDDLLREVINLSMRYVTDRRLPDKAIDLLDEAAALQALDASGTAATEEEHIL